MKIMNYLKSIISILLFFFAGCSLSAGAPGITTLVLGDSEIDYIDSLELTTTSVADYEHYCKEERKKSDDTLSFIKKLRHLKKLPKEKSSERFKEMHKIFETYLKPGAERQISLSREFRDGVVRAVIVPISNIIKEKEQNSKPQHTHHTDTQNAKDIRDIRADFNRFEEEQILGKKFTFMVELIKDLQDTPGNEELEKTLLTQFEILRKAAETEADSDAQQTIYTKFQATDKFELIKREKEKPEMLPYVFNSSSPNRFLPYVSPILHYFVPAKWDDYITFLIDTSARNQHYEEFMDDSVALSQLTNRLDIYNKLCSMREKYLDPITIPISNKVRAEIEFTLLNLDKLKNNAGIIQHYTTIFNSANYELFELLWNDSFYSMYWKYVNPKNWLL